MVLTAPMRAASGSRSSRKASTDSLCGIVTLAPRMRSSTRRSFIAAARSAALTSRSRYWQSMPSASKAAFCITGERLRETGSPSRSTLFMGEILQLRKEVRIGDGDAVRVRDRSRTGGNERRHRQRDGGRYVGGCQGGGAQMLTRDRYHAARLDIAGRPLDLDVGAHRS